MRWEIALSMAPLKVTSGRAPSDEAISSVSSSTLCRKPPAMVLFPSSKMAVRISVTVVSRSSTALLTRSTI